MAIKATIRKLKMNEISIREREMRFARDDRSSLRLESIAFHFARLSRNPSRGGVARSQKVNSVTTLSLRLIDRRVDNDRS